ncbi:hypothetical protein WICPIJ_000263 [Wickerhamomyces pijperi]|uniref:Uncharacterized protein n=1 Tax=Wickerhamomyces pijperi TaxID=599730 RepID=A0A9P8TS22_WICPI|nr:hypothetical protein WICPIJ_000263 [Wickerhamomyces pijperi]
MKNSIGKPNPKASRGIGKRLKFKTRSDNHKDIKQTTTATRQSDERPKEPINDDDQDQESAVHSRHSKPASTHPLQYQEWGPKINGYQFISTNPNDPKHYIKPKSMDYLINSYDWSYMKVPSYESFQEYLHEKYPDSTERKEGFKLNDQMNITNFDTYFQKWETSFKDHGLLLYPIFPGDELNKSNVLRFIDSSSLPMERVLKIERVKWHPDKFVRIIKSDKELERRITEVFQIVNQIYEDLYK